MQREPTITSKAGIHEGRLLMFDRLDSTNRWSLDHAASLQPGDVVCAEEQTAGRGRFDRLWVSPADRCLTLSVIVDTSPFPNPGAVLVPLAAAVAVSDTLLEHEIETRLKWPNDVRAGKGKIAGILAERESSTGMLVLGIGLNVNARADDFRGMESSQPATSMLIEADTLFDRNEVRETLQHRLQHRLDELAAGNSPALLADWNDRDALKHRSIEVQAAKGRVRGQYEGTTPGGQLALIQADGATRLFWSGDVSVRGFS